MYYASLAVHVAEPDPGMFEWVITERVNEDQWKESIAPRKDTKTYKTAMASGLMALEEMIADLDVGPRRDAEQTDRQQTPPKEGFSQRHPMGRMLPRPRGQRTLPYFGFGPIR